MHRLTRAAVIVDTKSLEDSRLANAARKRRYELRCQKKREVERARQAPPQVQEQQRRPAPEDGAPPAYRKPVVHPSRQALVPKAHVEPAPIGVEPEPAPHARPVVPRPAQQPIDKVVGQDNEPAPAPPAKRRKLELQPFRDPAFPLLPLERRHDGSISADTLRTLSAAAAVQARCAQSSCDCYKHSHILVSVRRRTDSRVLTSQIGLNGPTFFDQTSATALRASQG